MRNSDLLARIGGFVMLVSAFWNVVVAAGWVLALIWVLVGALWLVPLGLALFELGIAVASIVFGYSRAGVAAPLIGLFVSLCNLNPVAMLLELLNLVLMIGAAVARSIEE
jgi:hypothetical protein